MIDAPNVATTTAHADTQVFTEDDAVRCAETVASAEEEDGGPRLIPSDERAAAAAIDALNLYLTGLAGFAKRLMRRARAGGRQLSDDRLQGLGELIQNADDLGARNAAFVVDQQTHRLLFTHDGAGVSLQDVLALAVPFLSVKENDPDALGRFGIGLTTLQSLSNEIEIHQGFFHFRVDGRQISNVADPSQWPTAAPTASATTFVLPVDGKRLRSEEIVDWLRQWDEA